MIFKFENQIAVNKNKCIKGLAYFITVAKNNASTFF